LAVQNLVRHSYIPLPPRRQQSELTVNCLGCGQFQRVKFKPHLKAASSHQWLSSHFQTAGVGHERLTLSRISLDDGNDLVVSVEHRDRVDLRLWTPSGDLKFPSKQGMSVPRYALRDLIEALKAECPSCGQGEFWRWPQLPSEPQPHRDGSAGSAPLRPRTAALVTSVVCPIRYLRTPNVEQRHRATAEKKDRGCQDSVSTRRGRRWAPLDRSLVSAAENTAKNSKSADPSSRGKAGIRLAGRRVLAIRQH
jgi:hypothetical protein